MIVNTNDSFNNILKVNQIYQSTQRHNNSNSNNKQKNNSQTNFDKVFKEMEKE